ncbi:GH39 family glycosyl hydrolase [Nocardioides sp. T2.26MG-1]|uniref:GH39 family glycosyl hydrolase n=1 Tax=Nocardioides sp. T2.26MG-1 TaxID=3041166 RepID=UPI002477685B|nr:hypothetical protein [Nocardioides sp. T2.26MG-1]CAI9403333.1 hypothetical protein HIDPHFAB_03959 [Nocardioides sp. T2.26MG-1]
MLVRSRRTLFAIACTCVAMLGLGCSTSSPSREAEGPESTPSALTTSPTPSSAESPGPSEAAVPSGQRIQGAFFGMHDGLVSQGIAPDAPIGALRLWDSGTSWRDLEKSPGVFTWTTLDTAVDTAERMKARPLLVLGQTPAFHASKPREEAPYGPGAASMPDLGAWRRYVTAVAERYGNRIDYQIWNEANVVQYWTGTPRQMARLTLTASEAIREVVPKATIVAPAFPVRLESQQDYFADFWSLQSTRVDLAGAVDAVSVQLYPPADGLPEDQATLLDTVRQVLAENGIDLPVWNTEINFGLLGGPEPPPISAELQRAFVMRTYLLDAGLGLSRVYWYSWNIGRIANTYLTEEDLTTETLAGRSFDVLRDWLDGTRVEGCTLGDGEPGVWECVARGAGQVRTFWWKPRGPAVRVAAPDATSWSDADGAVNRCRGSCRVPVGVTPVMVVRPA